MHDGRRVVRQQYDRRGESAEWTVYAPMVFDGLGWVRIAGPQGDARAACMSVTAHIHLLEGLPLRELDARAEGAVRELEDGAVSVAVIDDSHRVDRIIVCSVAGLPRLTAG
jgi:hypothetical protein